jgi:Amt family ammonium transporter
MGPGGGNETEVDELRRLLEETSAQQAVLALNTRAIVIFFMQCGFAFLEAGSVRSKNTVNILIKNMLDAFIGAASYWAIGWGLAYGPDGNYFCGGSQYFNIAMEYEDYPKWFFQYVFAATAATIVSGAIAERCQFAAYFLYSIIITGWVYPVVSHWAWSGDGWLSIVGCTAEELEMNSCNGGRGYYMDYAGSGVVHLLGAGCSLTGCIFMGARRGRFNKRGEPLEMPGHSIPLAGLGGFILIFGFLAFNGGSQSTGADGGVVALAIVNTILGASMGGLSVLVLTKFLWHRVGDGKWSFLMTLNGALAGMVAQCAGCNVYEPWAAMVIGAGAAFVYLCIHTLMIRAKLDDPLDAVAVHGGGGLWGLICVPFFMSAGLKEGERGIIFDGHVGHPWTVLGVQVAAIAAILAWSIFWSSIIFGSMKLIKMLRVSTEVEFKGMDIVKHGESAYPAQAWVEFQYNKGAKGGGKGPTNPVMAGSAEITGITTMDGNTKNIDGEVFNNPFQMTAPRNGAGGVENRGMAMERNGGGKA